MTPQFLIAGHIVKDKTPDGWHAGGGALYAAAQAARLGIDTAVVTACDSDIEPAHLVPEVRWHVCRVEHSIEFENTYAGGARTQRLLSTSTPLSYANVPVDWRAAPIVLLTPVFHDVAPDMARNLAGPDTILGLAAQGWLRRLEGDHVLAGEIQEKPEWLHGDVVFLSEEDAVDSDAAERWREHIPTVVLTRGGNGYTVWDAMGRHDVSIIPGCARDPTGAGDVFATAYLVRYHETADVLESARFAAAAAAISVEGVGIASVATRSQIESRLTSGVAG